MRIISFVIQTRLFKGTVEAYFKAQSSNVLGGVEENHDVALDGRFPQPESNPERIVSAKQKGSADEVHQS